MLNLLFGLDFSALPASSVNGVVLIPFMLVSVCIVIAVGLKKHWGLLRTVFVISFVVYLSVLVEVLFFSIPIIPSEIVAAREYSHPRMNLVPFRDILSASPMLIARNLAGNLLLFVPLGFFLPILMTGPKAIKQSIAIVIALSIATEAIQYIGSFLVFQLNWKVVDIDDLILNMAGGFIGIAVYLIAWKLIYPNDATTLNSTGETML